MFLHTLGTFLPLIRSHTLRNRCSQRFSHYSSPAQNVIIEIYGEGIMMKTGFILNSANRTGVRLNKGLVLEDTKFGSRLDHKLF
jgi:hypothetical protein